MITNPPVLLDGYKVDHRRQYPKNSRLVFSNLTARGSRVDGVDHVVFFGLQYFILNYLIEDWNEMFFEGSKDIAVARFARRINNYLGPDNDVGTEHIEALHDLGYLPLEIKALPEGTHVPVRVPMMIMWNTHPDFFWLTNAIETILSTTIWMPCTSATTAWQYRLLLEGYARKTDPDNSGPGSFVDFQGHDFSFRGHAGLEAASMSGAAHLLSFAGTDTLPAIDFLEQFYGADCEKELVGASVPATEHSVMCMGGQEGEIETFERLITEVYPKGIVSIVSDTWDFWKVIDPNDGFLLELKDKIMARDGKVVIRPDSGDPVKILTGWSKQDVDTYNGQLPRTSPAFIDYDKMSDTEKKGLIQCLWEIFGGYVNNEGYKTLDSHIGAIYGDSITLKRAEEICERLIRKGFASTNVVYGIGSFTYQGAITSNAIVTRDTFGFAVKSTYGETFGQHDKDDEPITRGIEIFKDPITDDGLKKSAKGLTAVFRDERDPKQPLRLHDQSTWEAIHNCEYKTVFKDGATQNPQTLAGIRKQIRDTNPYAKV